MLLATAEPAVGRALGCITGGQSCLLGHTRWDGVRLSWLCGGEPEQHRNVQVPTSLLANTVLVRTTGYSAGEEGFHCT